MSSVLRIVLPIAGLTCTLGVMIIWNVFLALGLIRAVQLFF